MMRYGAGPRNINNFPGGMHYNGFMMFTTVILALVLLALVVFLIYKILKHKHPNLALFKYKNTSGINSANFKAMEILSIRYANGEITDEEFRTKKELLVK